MASRCQLAYSANIALQKWWRSIDCVRRYRKIRGAALCIQAVYRGYIGRNIAAVEANAVCRHDRFKKMYDKVQQNAFDSLKKREAAYAQNIQAKLTTAMEAKETIQMVSEDRLSWKIRQCEYCKLCVQKS